MHLIITQTVKIGSLTEDKTIVEEMGEREDHNEDQNYIYKNLGLQSAPRELHIHAPHPGGTSWTGQLNYQGAHISCDIEETQARGHMSHHKVNGPDRVHRIDQTQARRQQRADSSGCFNWSTVYLDSPRSTTM